MPQRASPPRPVLSTRALVNAAIIVSLLQSITSRSGKLLGPEYINLAFSTARRVDPHALLCYNDYDIESDGPDQAAKRKAVLDLLRGMQSRKVPIDALAFSHTSPRAPATPTVQGSRAS